MVKMVEQPQYIQHRLDIFNRLYEKQQKEKADLASVPIKITMPDGSVKEGQSHRTSPYEVASSISQGLAQSAVISKVNGKLWDMTRPLEGDCTFELIKFDDPVGKETFWHSSAHFLGQAMELMYGGDLAYGPPIADGFFYDMRMPEGVTIKEEECKTLTEMISKMSKEKQEFYRLVISKADLMEMFKYNPFKQRIIREKVMDDFTTAYRCGPLIDLCRGPHIRHAGMIKGVSVHRPTSSYWEGKADAESLQRVYGISFPDKQMLKDWVTVQEEAAKRDHRKIGKEDDLFFFNEVSAGSSFFTPKGTHIYKKLVDLQRTEYLSRGFSEVVTPNIYSTKLWKTSGHYQHYKDNMFILGGEKPSIVADEELNALTAALEEKDKAVVALKKGLTKELKSLEAEMGKAEPSARVAIEATINKKKAHPPIALRRAMHQRENLATKVEKKTDALIAEASSAVNEMKDSLVEREYALEEAIVNAHAALESAKLAPGDAFFAKKTLAAANAELPKDVQQGCC